MNIEIWEPVLGYEIFYHVSNFGRIKSLDRITKAKRLRKGKIMSPATSSHGYITPCLTDSFGKEKSYMLHRLIAIAFIPNPENKPFVNHINGIKSDNRIENLEWCTCYENTMHALENKLRIPKSGESCNLSKMKAANVLELRNLYANGIPYRKLALMFNISNSASYNIIKRISWKHI